MRCPMRGHRDGRIAARGTRVTSSGTWRRFTCTRPNGDSHWFSLMLNEDGTWVPVLDRPPACPEHEGSAVSRWGAFGKGPTRRQRYWCTPDDGTEPHTFSPPLSREVVSPDQECARCDELLSPHHGPITAARHTPWTLPAVVKALNDLSLGSSYADVSLRLRAQRDELDEHLRSDHGFDRAGAASGVGVPGASTAKDRRNAWRVAADLTEQYAPLLFDDVDTRYRARARQLRIDNDAAAAVNPNVTLEHPIVYVLDEINVVRSVSARTSGATTSSGEWHVLVVTELHFTPPDHPGGAWARTPRLRLARAYPGRNVDAWRLVLDELDVRPDVVVADGAAAIPLAVETHYGVGAVAFVPSLFHAKRNLTTALMDLPNTWESGGNDRKVLVDPLRKSLRLLTVEALGSWTNQDLTDWWDEFEAAATTVTGMTSPVTHQRRIHEPRLRAAMPAIARHPHITASNAPVEAQIRHLLEPVIENRAPLFGNLARTNYLLDLVVCRAAGTFDDLDKVAQRIRRSNEANAGWGPAPRQIVDRQLVTGQASGRAVRYESLRNPRAMAQLLKDRGLPMHSTTLANQGPTKRPPRTPRTRAPKPPTASETARIREWARARGRTVKDRGKLPLAIVSEYQAWLAGENEERVAAAHDIAAAEVKARQRPRTSEELETIRAWATLHGFPLKGNVIPDALLGAFDTAASGATVDEARAVYDELAKAAKAKPRNPIRDWARRVGMDVSVKGPIPAEVTAAYEAAQKGATVAAAWDVYYATKRETQRNRRADEVAQPRTTPAQQTREWARGHGLRVPDSGRLPKEVTDAYRDHHAGDPAAVDRAREIQAAKPVREVRTRIDPVRAWAQQRGMAVGNAGPVPAEVKAAYKAAHDAKPTRTATPEPDPVVARPTSRQIREWAAAHAIPLASRGAIPLDVQRAYRDHLGGDESAVDRVKARTITRHAYKAVDNPVRTWARDNGYDIGSTGPIPAAVQTAYDQAHPGDAP